MNGSGCDADTTLVPTQAPGTRQPTPQLASADDAGNTQLLLPRFCTGPRDVRLWAGQPCSATVNSIIRSGQGSPHEHD